MSLEYIQGVHEQVTRNEVIKQLKTVLASEFILAHNYGMQAVLIEGHQKEEIKKFLLNAQNSERAHAQMLIDRMIELGGNPDIRPLDWDRISACDYRPVNSVDQRQILDEAYESESCLSSAYARLLNFLETRDRTTYDLVNRILEEEYQDIEAIKKLQEGLLSTSERGDENGQTVR